MNLCRRRNPAALVTGAKNMPTRALTRIVPHFWYISDAEEAARFYTKIFPKSRVDRVWSVGADSPSGPAGSVVCVDFRLFGQPFFAMSEPLPG
jgi:predicted 3-demethylubiquinone-9 3-methyltransferase (glyoxalase superfamily)